ncbi:MAG TPA: hypothetical protein VMX17_11545 [Candidatus Glassbacteria bacterium]|nr:hypothetical protein [Candidatus Glassbacteria bacterium]
MDTSPEYILMCRKAMKSLQPIDLDPIDFRNQGYCIKHECLVIEGQDGEAICPTLLKISGKNREIWKREFCEFDHWIPLFYQDQLQDMVSKQLSIKSNYNHILYHLVAFLDGIPREKYLGYLRLSMEQLWLAFVMYELYHKKWDGTDWIKV